jgi:hypothetical protein
MGETLDYQQVNAAEIYAFLHSIIAHDKVPVTCLRPLSCY